MSAGDAVVVAALDAPWEAAWGARYPSPLAPAAALAPTTLLLATVCPSAGRQNAPGVRAVALAAEAGGGALGAISRQRHGRKIGEGQRHAIIPGPLGST